MSAAEGNKILSEHIASLNNLNFNCRSACPRVLECNAMVWAAIVRSVEAGDDMEEQASANQQADAAIGALKELEEPANVRCKDGPYYTAPGFMPTGGRVACKLGLISNEYYF